MSLPVSLKKICKLRDKIGKIMYLPNFFNIIMVFLCVFEHLHVTDMFMFSMTPSGPGLMKGSGVLQVCVVFDLEAAASRGELVFMERYTEVLMDLAQVEQKMDSQSMSSSSSSSEGSAAATSSGRARLASSGRSTLQAIGSAAAAGLTR